MERVGLGYLLWCFGLWLAAIGCDPGASNEPPSQDTSELDLVNAEICTPTCEGRDCGDDGCGGMCGECSGDTPLCTAQGVCEAECSPKCMDRVCGDDGCGGTCGACLEGVECLDGSCQNPFWVDPETMLMWENPASGNPLDWAQAMDYCGDLVLAGYSDWWLPTIGELRTLIRGCEFTESGGECNVGDEGFSGCLEYDCEEPACYLGCSFDYGPADGCYWPPAVSGTCNWYWSSSPVEDRPDRVWGMYFLFAKVERYDPTNYKLIRCVRSSR